MTLAGKKNHYNIKFLKGYGFSIKVKDSKIILKNCYDPFSKPEIEEHFARTMPYEKIVVSGKGYISTEALSILSENNKHVILLDTFGKPQVFLSPMMDSLTATQYRMAQYDTFRNETKRKYLAHQIVKAKLDTQIDFLSSLKKEILSDGISKLKEYRKNIDASPISQEAKVARNYFTEFAKLIPDKFEFESRNQSNFSIRKNNATDVINALLNYGYTVLAGQISTYINGFGLDAYCGFYHKEHTGFQPLVYDMIEPFRWLVDYTVFKLATSVSTKQKIKLKEFAHTRDGSVVMEYSLIKRFLEMLERNFAKERRYNFRHGAKTKDGLKSVKEIVVAKILVQNLAEYCQGKQKEFRI